MKTIMVLLACGAIGSLAACDEEQADEEQAGEEQPAGEEPAAEAKKEKESAGEAAKPSRREFQIDIEVAGYEQVYGTFINKQKIGPKMTVRMTGNTGKGSGGDDAPGIASLLFEERDGELEPAHFSVTFPNDKVSCGTALGEESDVEFDVSSMDPLQVDVSGKLVCKDIKGEGEPEVISVEARIDEEGL